MVNLGKTGRVFYGEDFRYTTQRTFSFDIAGIPEDNKSVRMQVDFVAKSPNSSKVTISHNGSKLNTYTIKGMTSNTDLSYKNAELLSAYDVWDSDLSSVDNISIGYEGSDVRNARLDFIRLTFKRKLQLYGNSVLFRNIDSQSK